MTNDDRHAPPTRKSEAIPPFSLRRPRFDRVRVEETEKCGLGVFADAPIKAGHAVGQVHGELKPADFRSHYCVEFADGALEPAPPYRFLNHCCVPNCEFVEWEIEDESETPDAAENPKPIFELWVHAIRDIAKGEELTIDYGWDWRSAIPCRCGSPDCRGWICKVEELETCLRERGNPEDYCEDPEENL